MTIKEFRNLKVGDLVIIKNSKKYEGLVFEVAEEAHNKKGYEDGRKGNYLTLKQPVFDNGYRLEMYGEKLQYYKG